MANKYFTGDPLSEDLRAQGAQIVNSITAYEVSDKAFYATMVNQGTTVREADVMAVVNNIGKAIATICGNGGRVKIPGLGTFSTQLGGVKAADGSWLKPLTAYIKWVPCVELDRAFQGNLVVEEVERTIIRPHIVSITDAATGSRNDQLTPGNMVAIDGYNLKIHPMVATEGVFFTSVDGGGTLKSLRILDNTPTRLTTQVPAELVSGDAYTIEVRNCNKGCKTLRRSDFPIIFTVA